MKALFCTIACLVLLSLFETSCTSTVSDKKCGPCPALTAIAPTMNFKVVDKTTGQDLFFGSKAKYSFSQLKMHYIINGKPDTAFLRVDTINQKFNIFISFGNTVDTATMQVADKPQDLLLFKIAKTGGCCSFPFLNSVTFNGTVVYTHEHGPDVVVFSK